MVSWRSFFASKNPATVWHPFSAGRQHSNERSRDRDRSTLVAFGREANIVLPSNVVYLFRKIDVLPCRESNFLRSTRRAKKETISNSLFRVHLPKQFGELVLSVRDRIFSLDRGQFIFWNPDLDPIFLQHEINNIYPRVHGLGCVPSLDEKIHVVTKDIYCDGVEESDSLFDEGFEEFIKRKAILHSGFSGFVLLQFEVGVHD